MTDMTDDTASDDVQDAEVVAEPEVKSEGEAAADVLSNLESMIKSNITGLDSRKSELRKYKEMLASALANDETYDSQNEEVKKATKVRNATRQQILRQTANIQITEKVGELVTEIKEMDGALSDYLREYARLTGSTEFETDDGEVREIVYVARLVKKSSRGAK